MKPRTLRRMVVSWSGDSLVEESFINKLMGVIPSYWGVIFGCTFSLSLAMVALNVFGVSA